MLTGVERAAEDGDFVSIDLEATLDGEVLEDGSTTGMSYEVGTGNLMEGLDDAVRGLSADESKTFTTALLSGPNAGQDGRRHRHRALGEDQGPPGARRRLRRRPRASSTPWPSCATTSAPGCARTKTLQQGAQARDKLVEHLSRSSRCRCRRTWSSARSSGATGPSSSELQQAGMDWDSFLQISGGQSREDYDAEQRKTVEEAVRTQFILDADRRRP